MVSYTIGAAVLLGLISTVTETSAQDNRWSIINAERPSNNNNGSSKNLQQRNRNLYGYKSDVDTQCTKKIMGNPAVCMEVCTEVTSVWNGSKLMDEKSKVYQYKCSDDAWEDDGHTSSSSSWKGGTEWPTYSPSAWSDDGWRSSSSKYGWKCVAQKVSR